MAERVLIGNNQAYVFKKSSGTQNKKVIVSAHGAICGNRTVLTPAGCWHTSSVGNSTTSQVRDILKAVYRNTISQNTGSKTGKNCWQRKLIACDEKDYLLARYADNSKIVYRTLFGLETFKYYSHVAENRGFDVISPRYKQKTSIIRLSTIIAYITSHNYQDIWLNFCLGFARRP